MSWRKNRFFAIGLILSLSGISAVVGTPLFAIFEHQNTNDSTTPQEVPQELQNVDDGSSRDSNNNQFDLSLLSEKQFSRLLLYDSVNSQNKAKEQLGIQKIKHSFTLIPAITTTEIFTNEIPQQGLVEAIDNRKVVKTATTANQELNLEQTITGGISTKTTANIIKIDELHDMGLTGKGIKLAIIDTGVDGNVQSFTDENGNSRVTEFAVSELIDEPRDNLNPHATHVAGIAAGNGQYSFNGQYSTFDSPGMAPEAEIISIRALDSTGFGEISWIVEGIEMAIKEGVDIISLSLSSELYTGLFDIQKIAVRNAVNNRTIVVAAAGNLGPYGSGIGIPGALPEVITVGAISLVEDKFKSIDESVIIWPQSAVGPRITDDEFLGYPGPDFLAPGDKILSIFPPDGSIRMLSGTSMATPHVSGGIALLLEAFPQASLEDIREALTASAVDIFERIETQGRGLVDFKAAYDILNAKFNVDTSDDIHAITATPRRIEDFNYVYRHRLSEQTKSFPIYLHSSETLIIEPKIGINTFPQVEFGLPTQVNISPGLNRFIINITLATDKLEFNQGFIYFVESESQTLLPYANVSYFSQTSLSRAKILFDASKDDDTGGNYFAAHNADGQFTQFSALLENEGHIVIDHKNGSITKQLLEDIDILIIADPEDEYSADELTAISDFLFIDGKSMLLIAGGGFVTAEQIDYAEFNLPVINSLLANTGLALKTEDGEHADLSVIPCPPPEGQPPSIFNRLLSCNTKAETRRNQDVLPELIEFPNFGPELTSTGLAVETEVMAEQDGKPVIMSSELNSNGRVLLMSSPLAFDDYGLTFGYGFNPDNLASLVKSSFDYLIEPRSIKPNYIIDNVQVSEFTEVTLHDDLTIKLSFTDPTGSIIPIPGSTLSVNVLFNGFVFIYTFNSIGGGTYKLDLTFSEAGIYDFYISIGDPNSVLIPTNGHLNLIAKLKYFDEQNGLRSIGVYMFFAILVSWILWLKNEGGKKLQILKEKAEVN